MKKWQIALVLGGSVVCLILAVHFGLTANATYDNGHEDRPYTDWGRVALTLIFGFFSAVGVVHCLRKLG